MAFERAELLFVFNFHPTQSFPDYRIGVEVPGEYRVVLDTDFEKYGGFYRVDSNVPHFTYPEEFAGRRNSIKVKRKSYHCIFLVLFYVLYSVVFEVRN